MSSDRYSVRYHTDTRKEGEYVRVVHIAWWLYDWKEKETVHMFPVSEQEQANAMCKLLNSIEDEGN